MGEPDETPGSVLAQLWSLWHLGYDPLDGECLCLSVTLPCKRHGFGFSTWLPSTCLGIRMPCWSPGYRVSDAASCYCTPRGPQMAAHARSGSSPLGGEGGEAQMKFQTPDLGVAWPCLSQAFEKAVKVVDPFVSVSPGHSNEIKTNIYLFIYLNKKWS